MRFGEIIEKAWKLTWRYRFLWVLAIFAGVTGPASSGGGNFNSQSGFPSGSDSSMSSGNPFDTGFFSEMERWLPIIVLVASLWIILSIAWAILGVAARGGLIWAVDEIESGRTPGLGHAWNVGFSRFWRMLGLSILLGLPIFLLVLILAAGILIPIGLAIARGGDAFPAALAPFCGTLVVGLPLLLVFGVVFGIMEVIAHRSIMLEGARVMDAAKGAWRTFRSRVKDSLLMWLISWGLSFAASIALAIPVVILTVVTLVPAMVAGFSGNWGALVGAGVVWLLVVLVLSFVFTAIWGTFTSALWTIFFRRLVGREVLPPTVMPNSGPQPQPYMPSGHQPHAPQPYAPGGVPQAPAPPMAPSAPFAPGAPMAAPVQPAPPTSPMSPFDEGPPMAAPQQPTGPSTDWASQSAPDAPDRQEPPSGEGTPPHA